MRPRGSRLWVGAAFAALGASTIFVSVQNLRLKGQLGAAYKMVRYLQSGAFLGQSTAGFASTPPALFPIAASAPTEPGNAASPVAQAPCSACTLSPRPALSTTGWQRMLVGNPSLSLLRLRRIYLPGTEERRLTLFVFFSPTDCAACLTESHVWEALYQEGSQLGLGVVGIVDRCTMEEAKLTLSELGVTFPTIYDENSAVRSAFRIPETPEKLLIDRSGEVLLSSPGDQTTGEQIEFRRAVERISRAAK